MNPDCHTIARQLSTYCMLNAGSVPSSGLYNGRAGLALALFQYADKNHDGWVEDEAFELLQQSLLADVKELSFEGGLAGIGYVLLYLNENHLVDADFEELFGKKHTLITDGCEQLTKGNLIVRHARIVHYLYGHHRYSGSRLSMTLAKKIASLTTDYLLSLMVNWEAASVFEKEPIKLEQTMSDYIMLAIHYPELYELDTVLERYHILDCSGLLQCNGAVRLVSGRTYSPSVVDLGLFSLRDLINLAVLEKKLGNTHYWENGLLSILNEEDSETLLVSRVHGQQYLPGYGFGLARLLLFLTLSDELAVNLFPDFV